MTQKKSQPQKDTTPKPLYATRFVGIDTHLSKRNGSTDHVFGIAGERPAGRKLAEDISTTCNQLDKDGYAVVSIFPLVSGRTAEASAEAAEQVSGRTYRVQDGSNYKHYVDTAVGYSVTDGVIIAAKRKS